jgi:RNA polymerase primary sigma factor
MRILSLQPIGGFLRAPKFFKSNTAIKTSTPSKNQEPKLTLPHVAHQALLMNAPKVKRGTPEAVISTKRTGKSASNSEGTIEVNTFDLIEDPNLEDLTALEQEIKTDDSDLALVTEQENQGPSAEKNPRKQGKIAVDYTGDSIRSYLQEIGRFPLLKAEEELELAQQVAAYVQITEAITALEKSGKCPEEALNTYAETNETTVNEVERAIHIGERAKNKMNDHNLRFVVSIAKKYLNRGVALEDLIQEGSLGLIRAVEKFDYTKGYRFSTYAYWWIKQGITRCIAHQSRTIRIPVHKYELLNKLKRVRWPQKTRPKKEKR